MRVICEINDCLGSAKIKVESSYRNDKIELDVDGKRYTVFAKELMSAIEKVTLDS